MFGEQQVRIASIVGGIVLVAVITYVRFCGEMSLPDKPPPPRGPTGTERQLLSKTTAGSPAVYQDYVEHDAQTAGVRAPSLEEMGRKLAYRVDESRHVLELGQAPIDVAGLRIHVERSGEDVVLVAQNLVPSDVAYEISTAPSVGAYACNNARPLPFNAMVISKASSETRTECVWRAGETIIVSKVETLEVPPMQSWYLGQTPPKLVGIDDRIARGHRGIESSDRCQVVVAQLITSGIEHGEIGWRDLADFYARHRCQTYQFPAKYRAFKSDNERPLPAVD
jgi:hypothetical protein